MDPRIDWDRFAETSAIISKPTRNRTIKQTTSFSSEKTSYYGIHFLADHASCAGLSCYIACHQLCRSNLLDSSFEVVGRFLARHTPHHAGSVNLEVSQLPVNVKLKHLLHRSSVTQRDSQIVLLAWSALRFVSSLASWSDGDCAIGTSASRFAEPPSCQRCQQHPPAICRIQGRRHSCQTTFRVLAMETSKAILDVPSILQRYSLGLADSVWSLGLVRRPARLRCSRD